jgi:hypothetical protein
MDEAQTYVWKFTEDCEILKPPKEFKTFESVVT